MKHVVLLILGVLLFAGFGFGAGYYVSKSGNDSNPGSEGQPWLTIQKAANIASAGDTVYIKSGTYNERVIVRNSGSSGNYITFKAYSTDTVTIDGNGVTLPAFWGGLLDISEVNYIKISGLRIKNAGPDDNNVGILMDECSYITIEKCYTYNTVGSGIAAWNCTNITIDDNEVELACNDGEQECITVAGTDTFEIKNNRVHNNGAGSIGGEGIDAKDGASNGKIYNNHVYNLNNRLGIYVDAWDKHTYNIEIYNNLVHDISGADGFTLASEAGGLLENIQIYNNIAYDCGICGITISSNGDSATHPMKDIHIINNTFYSNGSGEWGGGIAVDNADLQSAVIRNNILSQNLSFQMEVESYVPGQNVTADHNLIHGFRDYDGEIKGDDFVEGDPLFISASGADFHLQQSSPAIDAGSSTSAPSFDYDNIARPQGSGYDIGAYEYQVAASNPTISLNKTSISFSASEGSTTSKADTFSISNSGSGTLNWSLSDNAAWLSASPTSGSGSGTVTVAANPTGLSTGTYSGAITVTDSNATNSPVTVNVTFTISSTTIGGTIALDRDVINVAAFSGSTSPITPEFTISNTGSGTLSWSVSDDVPWMNLSPASGAGASVVTVTVEPSGFGVNSYKGTITVSATNATNTPQTITVNLTIKNAANDEDPIGNFDSPDEGAVVTGNIPMGGWALDDISVEKVEIWRGPISGESNGVKIGDAVFVDGARSDIETKYPTYPNHTRGGWGYMLLTNFLPDQGNGTFKIYAVITDSTGNGTELGPRTIIADNAHAIKPFGTIDTPVQGGVMQGTAYMNWGWALSPQPNYVPADGSTVNLFIEGVYLGHPYEFGLSRPDLTKRFPNYKNYNKCLGYYYIDTTQFDNGGYNMAWNATDSAGNVDGLGSRYITIRNTGTQSQVKGQRGGGVQHTFGQVQNLPNAFVGPIGLVSGYNPKAEPKAFEPGSDGRFRLQMRQLDRVVIHLGENWRKAGIIKSESLLRPIASYNVELSDEAAVKSFPGITQWPPWNTNIQKYFGYLVVGDRLRPLPIGSSLDCEKGIFYWQLGPGFLGEYHFVFIGAGEKGTMLKQNIIIDVTSKLLR